MHNESIGAKRHEWGFNYKGKELLPYAEKKRHENQTQETALREQMAKLIRDPSTFHNDAALQQLKRDIDRHSALREQFEVYCHEFARTPAIEFRLGLADVVYFGFLETPPVTDGKA
jgi:hypothetical protein